MTRLTLAVPGDAEARTGGTLYDRHIAAELARTGWHVDWLTLAASFPFPSAADIDAAIQALAAVPAGDVLLIDGLALGALPAEPLAALGRDFAALVHHPLAYETGLDADTARRLADTEKAALGLAAGIVTTSRQTASLLATAFDVAEAELTIVEPGTDPAPRSVGSGSDVVHFACLGSLTPRKAQDLLIEALASISDLPWRCTMAGSAERDPAFARELGNIVAARGLEGRIDIRGEVAEAERDSLLSGADVFVLASRFEGYGMVFAEALARGLPVVGCAAGAVPGVVPPSAGLLVEPDNVAALADALALMIRDEDERRRLAEGAWHAGRELPSWADSAKRVGEALRRLQEKA